MEANLGGTDILAPLEAVFALPPTNPLGPTSEMSTRPKVRNVFLLTDGEVAPPAPAHTHSDTQ
jgi:hypothetical protein